MFDNKFTNIFFKVLYNSLFWSISILFFCLFRWNFVVEEGKIEKKWFLTRSMEIDEFVREVKSANLGLDTRVFSVRNIPDIVEGKPFKWIIMFCRTPVVYIHDVSYSIPFHYRSCCPIVYSEIITSNVLLIKRSNWNIIFDLIH